MRATGFGFSIFLIAVGAVMAWGVSVDTEGFSINTIGLILFVVGLIGFVGAFALVATPSKTVVDEEHREVKVDASR